MDTVIEPKKKGRPAKAKPEAKEQESLTGASVVEALEPKKQSHDDFVAQNRRLEQRGENEAAEIADSRKSLKEPLQAGQAFFESPEGYIVVAEADRTHVFCKKANGGKGMLINPMR